MRRNALLVLAASLLVLMGLGAAPSDWLPVAHAQPSRARGWLGIVMDDSVAGQVRVERLVSGSPAAKAGLRVGDRLRKIHGQPIRGAKDVARAVGRRAPGQVIRVEVTRAGRAKTVPVRLGRFPSAESLLKRLHVGRRAPELVGLAAPPKVRPPTLKSLRGRVVVVDFWASWCVACRLTTNHLNRWRKQYGSRGLVVMGVASESLARAELGAQRFGIRYPIYADPDMLTSRAFAVRELPAVFVVDRHGVVRDVATGFDRRRTREMEALIQRLLAEPAPRRSP